MKRLFQKIIFLMVLFNTQYLFCDTNNDITILVMIGVEGFPVQYEIEQSNGEKVFGKTDDGWIKLSKIHSENYKLTLFFDYR